MLVSAASVVVWPDYRQFYVIRSSVDRQMVDIAAIDYESHFDEIDGFVMIGTSMMAAGTQVVAEVHDRPPELRLEANHIVETPLGGTGPVGIWSWDASAPETRILVPEDPLRMRVSWLNLDQAIVHPDNGGSDGQLMGPEKVSIQIWPSDGQERAVLKAWPSHWC